MMTPSTAGNWDIPGMAHSTAGIHLDKIYPAGLPECSEIDYELLTGLVGQAGTAAPRFSWEVINRLAASPEAAHFHLDELSKLDLALQRWFIDLFRPQPSALAENIHQAKKNNHSTHLPLLLLLGNFETILRYGRDVTAHSLQPQPAMGAFLLSLSHDLASRQMGIERRLQFAIELLIE